MTEKEVQKSEAVLGENREGVRPTAASLINDKHREPASSQLAHDVIRWVVWDTTYDRAYRGVLHHSQEQAQTMLGGVVWHSRARYAVRKVLVLAE